MEADRRTVLVRVDFNVPMRGDQVSDDARVRAAAPTIKKLRKANARIVLLSHFDRPGGRRVDSLSLRRIAPVVAKLLGTEVSFADDCIGEVAQRAVSRLDGGGVLLLENLRFHAGEEANDLGFARALARNGELFVEDAFSVCHRAHASTEAIARILPSCAGEAVRRELAALHRALGEPKRPVLGIVGGSKINTKLDLLLNLIGKLDTLAIVGGMANTFLLAQGHSVGRSFCEPDGVGTAREIMAAAIKRRCKILLPVDVVVVENERIDAEPMIRSVDEVNERERIVDAGPGTVDRLTAAMDRARTLIWNGPLGIFERPPFDAGTVAVAQYAAQRCRTKRLIAVAGGGDTESALNHAGVASDLTYVSNAGGAFLEWIEGKVLPGVEVLQI